MEQLLNLFRETNLYSYLEIQPFPWKSRIRILETGKIQNRRERHVLNSSHTLGVLRRTVDILVTNVQLEENSLHRPSTVSGKLCLP